MSNEIGAGEDSNSEYVKQGDIPSAAVLLDRLIRGSDRHFLLYPESMAPVDVIRQYASDTGRPAEFTSCFRADFPFILAANWEVQVASYLESYVYLDLIAKYPSAPLSDKVLLFLQSIKDVPDQTLLRPESLPSTPTLAKLAVVALKQIYSHCSSPSSQTFTLTLHAIVNSSNFPVEARAYAFAEWISWSLSSQLTLPQVPEDDSDELREAIKVELWQLPAMAPRLEVITPGRYRSTPLAEIIKSLMQDGTPAEALMRMQQEVRG